MSVGESGDKDGVLREVRACYPRNPVQVPRSRETRIRLFVAPRSRSIALHWFDPPRCTKKTHHPCPCSHSLPPHNSKPGVRGGRALIVGDAARGDNSPSSPEHSGEDHDHDEFVDAFDTMDDGWGSDGGGGAGRTPRASVNGTSGGLSLSPVFEQMANSPFHDLTPQEQVKFVERDGGIPYELCRDAWSQERHALRINELVNATKERVAREKNVDRAAANVTKRRMSRDEEDPPEMSMYDQAKGVVGRMQMGQDITKFELPATFLTPFSAIQASEDVLTIIAGTERSDKEWRDMSDTETCDVEQRFLNVLRLFLDMESLRCEEGTSGGTRSAFTMPPMKKPINSVLGETHRTRVAPHVEMVAEQVSHHPPITCWEVEHALAGLKITGNLCTCCCAVPKSRHCFTSNASDCCPHIAIYSYQKGLQIVLPLPIVQSNYSYTSRKTDTFFLSQLRNRFFTARACKSRCGARYCSSFKKQARRTWRRFPTCTSVFSGWGGVITKTWARCGLKECRAAPRATPRNSGRIVTSSREAPRGGNPKRTGWTVPCTGKTALVWYVAILGMMSA